MLKPLTPACKPMISVTSITGMVSMVLALIFIWLFETSLFITGLFATTVTSLNPRISLPISISIVVVCSITTKMFETFIFVYPIKDAFKA